MFKYAADTMVQEAGIVPLLHCLSVDSIMEGNTIKGIITESKAGRQAILAKRVIDATGDADIAFHAGVPYRKDPKEKLMGVSVSFGCSGVDVERLLEYTREHPARIGEWARNRISSTLEPGTRLPKRARLVRFPKAPFGEALGGTVLLKRGRQPI
jgi:hypothetical protein